VDVLLLLDKHIHHMYNQFSMIRTQVYLEDQIHKDLIHLAQQENKSMAEVTRDILKEGIAKRKTTDTSGRKALLALAKIGATTDDPYLSENIDHYLYGGPKRRP
jgi:hypothetical protein